MQKHNPHLQARSLQRGSSAKIVRPMGRVEKGSSYSSDQKLARSESFHCVLGIRTHQFLASCLGQSYLFVCDDSRRFRASHCIHLTLQFMTHCQQTSVPSRSVAGQLVSAFRLQFAFSQFSASWDSVIGVVGAAAALDLTLTAYMRGSRRCVRLVVVFTDCGRLVLSSSSYSFVKRLHVMVVEVMACHSHPHRSEWCLGCSEVRQANMIIIFNVRSIITR